MPYATADDLMRRFGEQELIEQTDRVSGANVDTTVVESVLADASATIDGYLAGRYSLPLAVVPPLLVGLCCDLARYALYPDAAPETVRARQQDALRCLRDIAGGTLRLGVDAAVGSGRAQTVSAPRLFARDA